MSTKVKASSTTQEAWFVPVHATLYKNDANTKVVGVYVTDTLPQQAAVQGTRNKQGKITLKVKAIAVDPKKTKSSRLFNFVNTTNPEWNITIEFLVQEGILDESALELLVE